ncbi:hypothetical protein F5148DRAFT_1146416 [Russula earlei]|uniref:Uncharacterized protein n=1 Tax=Russula earlei TaxID=71964 RepID=A0ACC0UMQ3_9AGAM|nr:hypothetical protein F5148DRAFT_1146416 [Russula earlei]
MHVPSLYGPSMSSPGHVKAAEETRREILAAWTEVEGKIPVLDKDRDPWTLIFYGTLAINSLGGGNSWQDGFGVLSDSHFFLFKKETTPTGTIIKYTHMINDISFSHDPLSPMPLSVYQERHYLAVGCTNGIYVRDRKGHSPPRRVLESYTPTSIVAVPEFHKFLALCESNLLSYPLDLLVRVSQAQGVATSKDLYDEEEKLNEAREDVLFFKAGHIANRTFSEQLGHISSALYLISKKVVYAAKNGKKVTSQLRELLPQNPVKYERLGSVRLHTSSERPTTNTYAATADAYSG